MELIKQILFFFFRQNHLILFYTGKHIIPQDGVIGGYTRSTIHDRTSVRFLDLIIAFMSEKPLGGHNTFTVCQGSTIILIKDPTIERMFTGRSNNLFPILNPVLDSFKSLKSLTIDNNS